jgi:hypothetical protein
MATTGDMKSQRYEQNRRDTGDVDASSMNALQLGVC